MKNYLYRLISISLTIMVSGCATAYISLLRGEYAATGMADGIYYGHEEYPRIYPASFIAVTEEIPAWWWVSKNDLERDYKYLFWIFGAPFSLVDLPISIVSDTIMLPYDLTQTRKGVCR